MNKYSSNPCIRCGTERITLKIWKEKIGNSTITNRTTVCPDPECQKKVNADNKKQSDKNTAMKERSEQRAIERKIANAANRIARNKKIKNKR